MKKENIIRLLWSSVIMYLLYFIIYILMQQFPELAINMFYPIYKSFISVNETYKVPLIIFLAHGFILVLNFVITLTISNQLKANKNMIFAELLGIICFSGLVQYSMFYINGWQAKMFIKAKLDVSMFFLMSNLMEYFSILMYLSSSLALLACAFSWYYKTAAQKSVLIQPESLPAAEADSKAADNPKAQSTQEFIIADTDRSIF
ncbi:MAG: hypothetical protein A2Y17_10825 [Clostridiales bacterium GWF2_38_85]|nr:MAG: hypothetical protein A2Y17_10825 [Clostridiales bacterium GWF2_38_85]HBL84620.1 hypothetical protein [Clostridiales bacterium]